MERVPGPIQASDMCESVIEPEVDGVGEGGVGVAGRERGGWVAGAMAEALSAGAAVDAGELTQ